MAVTKRELDELRDEVHALRKDFASMRLEFRSAKLAGRWLLGFLATAAALFSAFR